MTEFEEVGRDSRFGAVWFDAIDFSDIEPDWLIKGLLEVGTMSVVYGEPGCGKSFLATDIAMHVAAGLNWRDMKTRQGPVAYIAAEGGAGMRRRLAAMNMHFNIEGAPFLLIPQAVNLQGQNADTGALITEIKAQLSQTEGDLAMLVIDTLSRTFGGGNENAPDDMANFVKNVDTLRESLKCHVCVVHHTGKDQTRGARGHSSLKAATDTEIMVQDHGDTKSAKIEKQKDGIDGTEYAFRLEQVTLATDSDGDPVTSCIVEHLEGQEHRSGDTKLSDRQYNALVALRRAGMDEDQWFSFEVFKATIIAAGVLDADTNRARFTNLKDQLKRKGLIDCRGRQNSIEIQVTKSGWNL